MFQLIPEDIIIEFCGSAYLVVYLDHQHKVYEWNEQNNMAAIPIHLKCHDSMYMICTPRNLIFWTYA